MTFQKTVDLHDTVVDTLRAARRLQHALDASPVTVGPDLRRINQLMDELTAGEAFEPAQESVLETLSGHILGFFRTSSCPHYVAICEARDTPDCPFDDPEMDAARRLWEGLCDYRDLRQFVLDQVKAEQIVARLRRPGR